MSPSKDQDPTPLSREDAVERYLDGVMGADEARRFEARLEQEASLRESVALQRRIDASLGARWGQPEERGPLRMPPPHRASGSRKVRPVLLGALAAAVALCAVGVWVYDPFGAPKTKPYATSYDWPEPLEVAGLELGDFYAQQVAAGFTPGWVCDAEQFARAGRYYLGQDMVLDGAALGADRELLGVTSLRMDGRTSLVMLGRSGGRPVMLFLDRGERRGLYAGGEGAGLRRFERADGDLVLIEVTPDDAPGFLDAVRVAG